MRTFLGYVLVAAAIGVLYGIVTFAPVYLDHFDAKDIVNTSFNRFKEFPDVESFKQDMLWRLNTVEWATHKETDDFGNVEDKRGLGLEEDALVVEFDQRSKNLHVKLTYDRTVHLRPTDKVKVMRFVYEFTKVPPNLL